MTTRFFLHAVAVLGATESIEERSMVLCRPLSSKTSGPIENPSAIKDELTALEARKAAFTAALAEPPVPAMHPQMAEVFRQKAATLALGLEHDEQRDAARQALRGSLDKIVIP